MLAAILCMGGCGAIEVCQDLGVRPDVFYWLPCQEQGCLHGHRDGSIFSISLNARYELVMNDVGTWLLVSSSARISPPHLCMSGFCSCFALLSLNDWLLQENKRQSR